MSDWQESVGDDSSGEGHSHVSLASREALLLRCQDPKVRNQVLAKLSSIHAALEVLSSLTRGDFLEKTAERKRLLTIQRAVAIAAARYVSQITEKIPLTSLFNRARNIHESQSTIKQQFDFPLTRPTNSEVAEEIDEEVDELTSDVSSEALILALALAARTSLTSSATRLGAGSLPPIWNSNPVLAFTETFPTLSSQAATAVQEGVQSYGTRVAITITNAADPANLASRTELIGQLETRVAELELQTARNITTGQTSNIVNGIEHQVMSDSGVEERRLITLEDAKVERICLRDAAASWIPVDRPYPSGVMRPPQQHFGCRCSELARQGGTRTPSYLQS